MRSALVAGVDEAGRGPVLGPLVVACAVTQDPAALLALGVRDSKVLSPKARERLELDLKDALEGFALVVLEPHEIDAGRGRRSLNAIEAAAFARATALAARACNEGSLATLQVDAADTVEANFRAMLVRELAGCAPKLRVGRIVSEHKADARYPAVAAASILAKVERDRRVRDISARVGREVGSGYPSDPLTMAFLRDYIRANQDLPLFARRSWEPARQLLKEAGAHHEPLDRFDEGARP